MIPRTCIVRYWPPTNIFIVQVSLIEIYNEEIMDLLSTSQTVEKLKMYDDAKGGVKIKNMTEVGVKNKDDIYGIMERGSQKRKVAATEMNAHSSRSHCVFQIQINMKVVQEDKVEKERMRRQEEKELEQLNACIKVIVIRST